ncbi:MAG TPA: gluconokinase [Propionicimonas sp.]|jgi:carbohydrate kinase (thermoresistant glucokinase family)|uniref:gluconokinase n=1 Tax=Propionicimonas sp. TaxID=1955623 RepID=UPI002F3E3DAA
MSTHVVVMGVSGTGKSTVAKALQERLGWPFAEGDDLHPAANVAKMAAGIPLEDADRWPWLDAIAAWTSAQDAEGHSTIVTCSALHRAYRDRLRDAAAGTVFVHLVGSPELLAERMDGRKGHFMPSSLLASQLETLEPLDADEPGVVVDVAGTVEAMVGQALEFLV